MFTKAFIKLAFCFSNVMICMIQCKKCLKRNLLCQYVGETKCLFASAFFFCCKDQFAVSFVLLTAGDQA